MLVVGEPGLGKSRNSSRSSTASQPQQRHLTPGASGVASPSCCRTRRSIQSPNGGRLTVLVRTCASEQRLADPREGSLGLIGSSTQPSMRPCSHRSSTSRCRLTAPRTSRPKSCRRRQLAAMTAWVLGGRAVAAACPQALSRTCIGPTQRRSTSYAPSPTCGCASAALLVLATTRPEFRAHFGACALTTSLISLSPLDRAADRAKMVRDLSARHALSERA